LLQRNKASIVLVTFGDREREDFDRADLKKIGGLAYHFGQAFNMFKMDISRHKRVETLRIYDRRAKAFKNHAGKGFRKRPSNHACR